MTAELRELGRARCVELLATKRLGRVAVTLQGVPHIVPVNYALLDGEVVFRSGAGTKFHSALLTEPMSFQVDDYDELGHRGWSVLVSGRSSVVADPAVLAKVDALRLQSVDPTAKPDVVRIHADLVSGREIR